MKNLEALDDLGSDDLSDDSRSDVIIVLFRLKEEKEKLKLIKILMMIQKVMMKILKWKKVMIVDQVKVILMMKMKFDLIFYNKINLFKKISIYKKL